MTPTAETVLRADSAAFLPVSAWSWEGRSGACGEPKVLGGARLPAFFVATHHQSFFSSERNQAASSDYEHAYRQSRIPCSANPRRPAAACHVSPKLAHVRHCRPRFLWLRQLRLLVEGTGDYGGPRRNARFSRDCVDLTSRDAPPRGDALGAAARIHGAATMQSLTHQPPSHS